MTLDEQITAWALAQSEACKLALLEQRAAVMPLRPDEILSDNPYAPRRETIICVVRPGEKREVPEIVGNIRRLMEKVDEAHPMDVGKRTSLLGAAILEIADHFEAEARKPEPPEARG